MAGMTDEELESFKLHMDVGLHPTRCVEWTGQLNGSGYGRFWKDGKWTSAHVLLWEHVHGPKPGRMDLDHKCRNRKCVAHWHLELVTRSENARRGNTGLHNKVKTHCPQGHEYTPENTGHSKRGRRCLTCHRERERIRRERKKG